MSTDRFREADRLLEILLDLPAAERPARLDRECAGDPDLRALVERLLARAESESGFLSPGAPLDGLAAGDPEETFPGDGPRLQPGGSIGPYVLRERIGSGGFGDVWLADQTHPVRRRVAIKILKAGMDTHAVLARFEAESQALAMMDHPNIAKVFDVGETERGLPFFVMEHVPGPPITDYCDRHRLTTRERLELFRAVCGAVQHAHGKGIIHRDLKPSNILVSLAAGDAVPKVIDFGIAKATSAPLTDRTLHTMVGQMLGTPAYMSPEQISAGVLHVDTRTDVYALGVILYELLTGTRPFGTDDRGPSGWEALQRRIVEEDPEKPSTRVAESPEAAAIAAGRRRTEPPMLRREIRGELDWITMKALEKDRTRRYETASDFAHDIGRYLAGEPVEAGPPGTAYRFRKFARRHKLALGATAAVGLAVLVAAGTLAWALVDSNRQRARVEAALAETQQARAASDAVTRFVTGMLGSADPGRQGRDVTVVEVLDDASAAVPDELGDNPALEARVRVTLGETYHSLGELDAAVRELERAADLEEGLLGADDRTTLSTRRSLAVALRDRGDLDHAEEMLRGVLRREEAAFGAGDSAVAVTTDQLGAVLTLSGRYDEAATVEARADSLARIVFGDRDPRRAKIQANLAVLSRVLGHFDEARAGLSSALEVLVRSDGEESPDAMDIRSNLANVHYQLGEYAEAAEQMTELIRTKERVLGPEHPSTLQTKSDLATTWNGLGRTAEAESLGLVVLEARRRVLGDENPGTLQSLNNLAAVYMRSGRYQEAEPLLREAYETKRRVLGPEHLDTLITQGNLGDLLQHLGQRDEGLRLLASARETADRVLPEDHQNRSDILRKWADGQRAAGHMKEAEAALRTACARLEAKVGPDHLYTRRAVSSLVDLLESEGRADEAAEWRAKLPVASGT